MADNKSSKREGGSPAPRSSAGSGSRPAGSGASRPAGSGASRPAGSGSRPAGSGASRPAGSTGSGPRPSASSGSAPRSSSSGAPSRSGGSRPGGPGGSRSTGSGARTSGSGSRPGGSGSRPGGSGSRPFAPHVEANLTPISLAKELKVTLDSLMAFVREQGFGDIDHEAPMDETLIDLLRDHQSELSFQDPAEVHLKPPFIVRNIAEAINEKPHVLVSELLKMKVFATVNQSIDQAKAEQLLKNRGLTLVVDRREKVSTEKPHGEEAEAPEKIVHSENPGDRVIRPPVVAVMGHVDHGKTTLLDKLRDSRITAGEAGGITQHTGASTVTRNGHTVTFIDTPGHAAFSAMRARGASATDICILLVAADDGVNVQTKEAFQHIQKAGTPYVVLVNKMDLPNANLDNVLKQLQQLGILTEEWGGDIGLVKCSAKTGEGLDELIERLHLEAEIHEIKGNPKIPGRAFVVESELEQGMGPTSSIIVKDGTIHVGDVVICGEFHGKVKALIDAKGTRIKSVGPGLTAKVLGLDGVPDVGAAMVVCKDEKMARETAQRRAEEGKKKKLSKSKIHSLEELMKEIQESGKKSMRVVLKTDVRGTGEAIQTELEKIISEKINLDIVENSVGAISMSDVQMAGSSGSSILGFHVRVNPGVNAAAKAAKVDIKLYSIIYELIDDVRRSLTGMLDKNRKEIPVGKAEILQVFFVKAGKICGSSVRDGKVKVGMHARVWRSQELIYNGTIKNLKRFRDDVKEVSKGNECGILLDNFNDFEIGDIIEIYDYEMVAASL